MKIASYQVMTLAVPEDDPLANMPEDANRKRPTVILRLRTDSGIEGIGVTLYGGRVTRSLHAMMEDLCVGIVGEDPMRNEALLAVTGLDVGDTGITKARRYLENIGIARRMGVRWIASTHRLGGLTQLVRGAINVYVDPLAAPRARVVTCLHGVPTVDEAGVKGFEDYTWNGLSAPAGVPRDVLTRLHAEVVKALQSPDLRSRFAAQGIEIAPSASYEEFTAFVRDEVARNAKLARDANIKVE